MRLGFLTACMPDRSLEEIAAWAAEHRFEALEVAAWPDLGDRPFTATHIDVADLDQAGADGSATATGHGLDLCRWAFYYTTSTPTRPSAGRQRPRAACIDAASFVPDRRDLRRPLRPTRPVAPTSARPSRSAPPGHRRGKRG